MKRVIAIAVMFLFLFSSLSCFAAATPTKPISVLLNGTKLKFDVDPFIENGRTLVPFRGIFEALGAEVGWDGTQKIVTGTKGPIVVKLKIGDKIATLNKNQIALDVAAKITGSRTFVPLRFISESLGAKVEWNGTTRTITITSDYMFVSLQVDKNKAEVGEIIRATVKVNNIENFSGIQYNIKYDPNVLEPVNPDTGEVYDESTQPLNGELLNNTSYTIMPIATNDLKAGTLNFSRGYMKIAAYKAGGKAETTGSVAIIGFKVKNKTSTTIKFENSTTLEMGISGTMLFNWDGNKITSGYTIVQPGTIN